MLLTAACGLRREGHHKKLTTAFADQARCNHRTSPLESRSLHFRGLVASLGSSPTFCCIRAILYTIGSSIVRSVMSRKTKERKKSKTRKKGARKYEPYAAVKMKFFERPDMFGDAPTEIRRKAIRQAAVKAKAEFDTKFKNLQGWFDEFDGVYLLAFCVYYFMTSERGVDKEAIDGRVDFAPHYLELLQAFALMKPRALSVTPLLNRSKALHDTSRELTALIGLLDLDLPEDYPEEEFRKKMVASQMRTQTMMIRNWAYPKQNIAHTKDLFGGRLAKVMNDAYAGIEIVQVIDTLEQISELINARLNAHLRRLAPMWRGKTFDDVYSGYRQEFPDLQDQREEMREVFRERCRENLRYFKEMLITHADLLLKDIFTFSHSEFMELYGFPHDEGVRQLLARWSLSFGELKDKNPKHFIVTNPVLTQPLISVGTDSYFWALCGVYAHALPAMMEFVLPTASRELYMDTRSLRLEDVVEKMCRGKFHSGRTYRSVKWSHEGRQYETDVLVVVDTTALILECKAGLVDPPARRGGEDRLEDTLYDLVLKPTMQANRLIDLMKAADGTLTFLSANGETCEIDPRSLVRYVPVSVTYENLGFVSGNLKESIRAGLLKFEGELAPSICLMDLEVIFSLLQSQAEVIHYLSRRATIEKTVEYHGDESDLLALYLESGFNIPEWEEEKIFVSIATMSKQLDPFFTAAADGVSVPKPRLDLTDWWRATIARLELRQQPHWTELAFALLCVLPADQRRFETELKELAAQVRAGTAPQKHNWVVLHYENSGRRYAFVGYAYREEPADLRNQMLQGVAGELIENGATHGVVLIGHDVERATFPYDVIAFAPPE